MQEAAMTVSAREAFKLGFLQRCADEKLRPEQVELRIKQAAGELGQAIWQNTFGGKYVTDPEHKLHLPEGQKWEPGWMEKHPWLTGGALAGAAIGIPALLGMGAGNLAGKLEGDFLDKEDVQKQETINELRTLAERSKHSQSKALGL
jgi:hypothetical protein